MVRLKNFEILPVKYLGGTAQGVAFRQTVVVQGFYFTYLRSWTKVPLFLLISGSSNSCQSSEYCNLNHQVCLPKCTSNRDCEDGYKCSEGKCLKICENSNQCPSNTYCHK